MSQENPFLSRLARGLVLFDGAMGTQLYERGIYFNRCFDELNLSAPETVLEVHRSYAEAGAQVLETNTFGGSAPRLAPFGLSRQLRQINRRGAELARQAAGQDALVAGAIGPLGIRIEPWGPTSLEEARAFFREQAAALAEGGVDLFALETFVSVSELRQAYLAVREVSALPVVAMLTIQEDGRTPIGTAPEIFTRDLDELGPEVIGLNCSVGPHAMLETLKIMRRLTDKPLAAMPNAGIPRSVEGRNLYLCTPEYMATYARYMIQEGVQVLGGCCGTTPAHIRAIRQAMKMSQPTRVGGSEVAAAEKKKAGHPPLPLPQRSRLAAKLSQQQFVASVEVTPPRGCSAESLLQHMSLLRQLPVDAVNIPDGPRASARMGALPFAVLLQQTLGLEAILHYTCRDRNLLAMQSDLLGAHALGVRNLLLITGDPPKMGTYPDATAVYDVDSIGLTNLVARLNRGLDLGDNDLHTPTSFLFGVGVNPGAIHLQEELRRFQFKVEAGAEFAITQPVFDVPALRHFLQEIAAYRLPVIAGIWPLLSYRNAEFIRNEVHGVVIPDPIMERMRKAQEKNRELDEGIAIAVEILEQVRPLVRGVQISAPLNRLEQVVRLMRHAG